MGSNSELSVEVRAQIIALHNEGLSCRAIASRLKCHHATVVSDQFAFRPFGSTMATATAMCGKLGSEFET